MEGRLQLILATRLPWVIPSNDNMPSANFVSPTATIQLSKIPHLQLESRWPFRNFSLLSSSTPMKITSPPHNRPTNKDRSRSLSWRPSQRLIKSHSQTPKKFIFFKGLNSAAVDGILTADVPAGFYKISINTAANHQPVLVPVEKHGSLDNVVCESTIISIPLSEFLYQLTQLLQFTVKFK